tara:strand:+ start:226 stop:621 length:396 start_codon:yes stop_codon:yes gene_type:complete
MSTLKVDTIQNTSGGSSSTPEQIEQGRAKAWGTFDGTATVGKLSTFNFSSITDLGVGYYTLTFENNMPDTNYAIAGNAIKGDSNDDGNQILQAGGNNNNPQLNVNSFNVRTKVASNNSSNDCDKFHVIVFR